MSSLVRHAACVCRLVWLRRVGVLCLLVLSARLVISRLEAAGQLWRFTMSLVTALLQRMPRITHS